VYGLSERELEREPPEVRLRRLSKVQKRNPNSDKARWAFHAKKTRTKPCLLYNFINGGTNSSIRTGTYPVQKLIFTPWNVEMTEMCINDPLKY
jgi:hypothetical protein